MSSRSKSPVDVLLRNRFLNCLIDITYKNCDYYARTSDTLEYQRFFTAIEIQFFRLQKPTFTTPKNNKKRHLSFFAIYFMVYKKNIFKEIKHAILHE